MKQVAAQIGAYLAAKHPTAPGSRWEASQGQSASASLGSGVEIWTLGHNTMGALHTSHAASLARHRVMELAENSRTLHHLILRNNQKPVGFAETARAIGKRGAETWQLRAVGLLPAASRDFAKGLSCVNQSAGHRSLRRTRLLRIPAINLGILWLEGAREDRLVVYRKPRGKTGLSSGKLYTWPDFVQILGAHMGALTLNSSPRLRNKMSL